MRKQILLLAMVPLLCLPLTGCLKQESKQSSLAIKHKIRTPYKRLRARDVKPLKHAQNASRRNYLGRYETEFLTRVHPLGVRVVHEDVRLRLIMPFNANFNPKSSTVNPALMQILDSVAAVMKRNKKLRSVVYGFTDSKGDDKQNQALSERRSHAVIAYLESQGVESVRLITIGKGSAKPIADNNTDEGRLRNRRVELTMFQGPLYYD